MAASEASEVNEATERLVFLDTETTGLDPKSGHRIIEVAGVEAIGRRMTGRYVHFYINPEREVDEAATAVHGFTWDDLREKPKFAAIATELLDFLRESRLIIHNAPFDVGFLDHEFKRLNLPPVARQPFEVQDSLALARSLYPGKRNGLDALCERLGVDNSHRNLHGALLDARLLGEVYLAMTRGQSSLEMLDEAEAALIESDAEEESLAQFTLHAVPLPEHSVEQHERYLAGLAKSAKTVFWSS